MYGLFLVVNFISTWLAQDLAYSVPAFRFPQSHIYIYIYIYIYIHIYIYPFSQTTGWRMTRGSRRTHRMWETLQDLVGPACLWPRLIRSLFWMRYLRNGQRVVLCMFCFVNDVLPGLVAEDWNEGCIQTFMQMPVGIFCTCMRPCALSGTRTCTLTTCPRNVMNRQPMGHPGSTRTNGKGTCNPPAHYGDQGIAASMALPQKRPGPHMQPWAGAPDNLLWVPRVDLGVAIGAPPPSFEC